MQWRETPSARRGTRGGRKERDEINELIRKRHEGRKREREKEGGREKLRVNSCVGVQSIVAYISVREEYIQRGLDE